MSSQTLQKAQEAAFRLARRTAPDNLLLAAMQLTISEDIAHASRLSEEEMRRELALALFQRESLTLAQAARLAGMSFLDFQHQLAGRHIPLHYGVAEFEEDLKSIDRRVAG
jgi:predicted HTH domain antitoxin